MTISYSREARTRLAWRHLLPVSRPQRRSSPPASPGQRAPYGDAFFADPAAVEDDYRRLSRIRYG